MHVNLDHYKKKKDEENLYSKTVWSFVCTHHLSSSLYLSLPPSLSLPLPLSFHPLQAMSTL